MKPPVLDVAVIGGGMFTNDVLLPSLYHRQRTGTVGRITICARHNAPLRALQESPELRAAFPGQDFAMYPPVSEPAEKRFPEAATYVLAAAKPRQAVVVCVPDQQHYPVVMEALRREQHVLCVKPLVLKRTHAAEIEKLACERELYVGVEYHKRFDRRSLVARRQYRAGQFGTFVSGEAKLIEPYYYRHSNFQNWFTCDQTDPFVYIGCHYVDLVFFITGLKPVAVSVAGVKGNFPNGNEAYLWTHARVRFENGALLAVANGLGYPDAGAGNNDQGLTMYCEGNDRTGLIQHNDQDRGVHHCRVAGAGAHYKYVNPDFFQFVPWDGPGAKPVGYGFDSVAAHLDAMQQVEAAADRRQALREIDAAGLLATPANSFINEQVVEAARASLLAGGVEMEINHG